MDELQNTDNEMHWQSSGESVIESPNISRHNSSSSLLEESAEQSPELPPQANDTGGPRKQIATLMCVRCRLLERSCSRHLPSCQECLDLSLDCLYMFPTDNDKLFKTLPVGAIMGNAPVIPMAWRSSGAWNLLPTSREFLQENVSEFQAPEDVYSTTENPLRRQKEPRRVDELMSGQLQDIIAQYPEDPDAADQAQLPLPSSELLSSISNSIARREAEKLSQQIAPGQRSLNEAMSGSSLLALGE
ncbi:hypothetical protein GGI03_003611 [Coemansia sp. RSA 2337]|nr:hypothetical protein GGI03_003611 [Coemansia sp. RSA 2337]